MLSNYSPIGVIDSGIGGLTVVKELQKLLPHEDILFFGDNKNVPYGNKTLEQITVLTRRMLDKLVENNIKVIVIACNTISSMISTMRENYDVELIGIIAPAISAIKTNEENDDIGLLATKFTVNSKAYDIEAKRQNKDVHIISEGSAELAEMIENLEYKNVNIEEIIRRHISFITSKGSVDTVILGCTHYPILMDMFKDCCPGIKFIDPAYQQALSVREYLSRTGLLNDKEDAGSFEIYTSGSQGKYMELISELNMKKPDKITVYNVICPMDRNMD